MNAAAARTDIELRMAEGMVDCAHALGLSFGQAAQAESDFDRRLKLHDAFHRSFQALRLGIRLCLTLRSGPARAVTAPANAEAEVVEPEEADRAERETAADPPDRERGDRETDYEPVSLTKFLATLRGVAADAGALQVAADPAVLPRLQGLLAQADGAAAAKPDPSGDTAVKVRPAPGRARWLGSAAPPLGLAARPHPPPRPSG